MRHGIAWTGVSLASLIAASSPALAATTTVTGGGSTAAAKVYRDIFNAYTAYSATKATSNYGIYCSNTTIGCPTISPGNPANVTYPKGPNSLAVQGTAKVVVGYEPVGSGAGLSAYTTGNPANFGSPATSNTIAYINSDYTNVASTPYPQIQFAASDAYLGGTQTAQQASTYDGNSVNDTNAFQLPTFALPIMLPITGTSASHITNLKTADLCAIYSGNATTTSAGITLTEAVVRADGSGTSFIFSDYLAQACPALGYKNFTTANGFPSTKPSWSAVFALGTNALPLVLETGTGGVAAEVSVPTGGTGTPDGGTAIGYASPDYVPPVATGNDYPATVNSISGIVNTSNVTKSTDEVYAAITGLTLPTKYVSSTIGQQLNDPLTNGKGKGYPLVGFTFIEAYKCYSTTIAHTGTVAQGTALKLALEALYPTGTNTNASNVLASQGFEPILSSGTSKTSGIYKLLIDGSVSAGYGPLGTYGIQGKQDPKNTTKNFACPAN